MKLEQWVIFIDMLGYREINRNISNDEKGQRFLKFMKSNESIFISQNRGEIKEKYRDGIYDLYKYYDIQATFVSDSLIINYKPIEVDVDIIEEKFHLMHSANTLFIIINRLQTFIYSCLKEHKILIRGGISNKYCLIKDNYAVGEGLIDAYINESKRAIYPRIVLSENISDNKELLELFDLISIEIYGEKDFIKEDGDGIYYIDYIKYNICSIYKSSSSRKNIEALHSYLKVYRDVIISKLNEVNESINNNSNDLKSTDRIKDKIIWLKNYYNECVKNIAPTIKIE